MATSFPQAIQNFETALDVTPIDGSFIEQYQAAKEAGNYILAAQILAQIPNASQKTLTADKLNLITDTCKALQEYYLTKYSPAYIVSETQPPTQDVGDFWFEVTG